MRYVAPMDRPLDMRTPDGAWTLRSLTNRAGAEVYLVRQHVFQTSTTQVFGRIVDTLEQAAAIMGDAFDLLTSRQDGH